MKIQLPYIILFAFIFSVTAVFSQTGSLTGKIKTSDGLPAEFVNVGLAELGKGSVTNNKGEYEINNIKVGIYKLQTSYVGCVTQKQQVEVKANQTTVVPDIILKKNSNHLTEVEVVAKSKIQEIKESGFAVEVIDTKKYANTNTDINQILNKTSGIHIRESGGLGSDFNFSLNGFSGNQVRFFLDGIPMDNWGSSLTLNNIPPNLVSRIEVYKGVLPVHLGSDALGGAINLISNSNVKNYLDVSYSYGSFNTHRASVLARVVTKSGFIFNNNLFYNYSDNNYWIDAQIPDAKTGKVGNFTRIKRFHDAYNSVTEQMELGVRNQKYADYLLLGLIYSGNKKDVQQGANMTKVAGQIYTMEHVIMPTLKYKKDSLFGKSISMSLYASYNYKNAISVDTSSRTYDWLGNYTTKKIDATSGELTWDKTLFTFRDQVALTVANFSYQLNKHNSFSLNNTFSRFRRVGEDEISYSPVPFSSPNVISKNITGLSYKLDLFKNRWSTIVFSKAFIFKSTLFTTDWDTEQLVEANSKFAYLGKGCASSFALTKWSQIKTSFENTYRLPEGYEMFGDGLLLEGNAALQPERSTNFNLGVLINIEKQKHKLKAEANYLHRTPENMIRLTTLGVMSQYENLRSAKVDGVEGEILYTYNTRFSCELNATYQNVLNNDKYEGKMINYLYLDRVPNTPFFFANAVLGSQFKNVFVKDSKLSIEYSLQFVEAFYLKWPSQGSKDQKYDIPRQVSHDVSLSYSFVDGKYNISLACFNITNAARYDNFMLQKPGRSLSIKLRYFITGKSN